MTLIEQKAQELVNNTVPEPSNDPNAPREFAIMTVIAAVELITELIKLYQACKKTPVQAYSSLQNPTIFSKIEKEHQIRLIRRKYNLNKNLDEPLAQNLDGMAKQLTQEEFNTMYEEAKTIQ